MTTATQRVRQPGPLPDHGDVRRYRRGCTCPPCTSAATAEAKKWEYLRSIGRSSLVPAGPTIARIWALRAAGMTDAEIDTAADLKSGRLNFIIRTGKPIRHFTAARILAVPVPEAAGEPTRNGAFVPSLGTTRRLQALTADGWPACVLEKRMGTGQGYVSYFLRGDAGDTVRLFTAASVRRLCHDLQRTEPQGNRGAITSARKRAARNGWAGTAYWDDDDYDNPDFTPAVKEPPRYAVLAENGLELERLGHTRQQAADRLGVTKDALQHAIDYARKAATAA
ncbi:hypothetical protein AB0M92_18815 [Streptomyces sp. NPDC051582]|uniref:hypothetical protein n=1 Tax=Streptomyces sp. NPDC051582 TaxID=3155167 RepID=UPI00342AEC95